MTDNHKYTTPEKGAEEWHMPLNNNFEQIDTDIEIRDKEANLNDYIPKEGAKFLAIDTGISYIGNGSSWKKLAINKDLESRLGEFDSRLTELEEKLADEESADEETKSDLYVTFDDDSSFNEFHDSAHTSRIDIVSSPVQDGVGSLRYRFIEGSNPSGRLIHYLERSDSLGYKPHEMYARFWLRFDSNFQPSFDGKLPGFMDNSKDGALGGRDGPGWSARMSFYDDSWANNSSLVPIGYYVYHQNMGIWGDHELWDIELERDRWYQIDQYVKLNDIGSANGVLRGWVDGDRVYDESSWEFIDDPDLAIEQWRQGLYHGGSEPAPSDMDVYLDELHLSENPITDAGYDLA
ncbi:polysaccharide lyase [Natrialbaceae archaeon A-CW1-1]